MPDLPIGDDVYAGSGAPSSDLMCRLRLASRAVLSSRPAVPALHDALPTCWPSEAGMECSRGPPRGVPCGCGADWRFRFSMIRGHRMKLAYLSVADARERDGLRLVLTAGVPGPWGEAAKYILHVKGIAYAPVAQMAGMPNEDLVEWTGCANAPVAVYNDEAPKSGWAEILFLAERLASEPRLIPGE